MQDQSLLVGIVMKQVSQYIDLFNGPRPTTTLKMKIIMKTEYFPYGVPIS